MELGLEIFFLAQGCLGGSLGFLGARRCAGLEVLDCSHVLMDRVLVVADAVFERAQLLVEGVLAGSALPFQES